jgi:hypothetical protein
MIQVVAKIETGAAFLIRAEPYESTKKRIIKGSPSGWWRELRSDNDYLMLTVIYYRVQIYIKHADFSGCTELFLLSIN